ncbi:MAG: carbon-nitrogen hydrolase family protein [Pseudomonadota bacterium]
MPANKTNEAAGQVKPMRIACIQMRSGLSRSRNVETATAYIREAAREGATFIATPEMTNVVDRKPRRLFEHLPFADKLEEADHFAALSQELGVHLLIGSMAVALNKDFGARKMANRAHFFAPNGQTATYDKIHLFDVDLPTGESWKESATIEGGDEAVLVRTPFGGVGLSICYDVRFAHLYRTLAKAGADILAVPAAFTVPTGEAHWSTLLRARAIETGSFVVAPAQGGAHEDGRVTYGHSMVIDAWGRVVAEKPDDTPGVLLADVDLSLVRDVRARIPSLGLDCAANLRTYGL